MSPAAPRQVIAWRDASRLDVPDSLAAFLGAQKAAVRSSGERPERA